MAIIGVINEYGMPAPGPATVVPQLDLDQYPMGAVPGVTDQLKDHLRRHWLKYLLAGGFFGYHANKKFNNYNVALNHANLTQNAFNQMQNLHNELKNNFDQYNPTQRTQMLAAYKNLAAQLMPNQAAIINNFGDHQSFLNFMDKSGRDIAANVVQHAKDESDKAAQTANASLFGSIASKFGFGAKTFNDGKSGLEQARDAVQDLLDRNNQSAAEEITKQDQAARNLPSEPTASSAQSTQDQTQVNSGEDPRENLPEPQSKNAEQQAVQSSGPQTWQDILGLRHDKVDDVWGDAISKYGSFETPAELTDDHQELQILLLGTGKNGKVDPEDVNAFNNLIYHITKLNNLHNQGEDRTEDGNHEYENAFSSSIANFHKLVQKYPDLISRIQDLKYDHPGIHPEVGYTFRKIFNPLIDVYSNMSSKGLTLDQDKVGKAFVPDQVGKETKQDATTTVQSAPVAGETPVQSAPVADAQSGNINDTVAKSLDGETSDKSSTTELPPSVPSKSETKQSAPRQRPPLSDMYGNPIKGTQINNSLYNINPNLQSINELVYNNIIEDDNQNYTYSEPEENKEKESGSNSHLKTFGKILAAGGLAALGAGAIHQLKNSHLQNAQMYKNAKQKPQELNSLAKANTLNSVDLIQKVKEMKDKYMASRNQEESESEQK